MSESQPKSQVQAEPQAEAQPIQPSQPAQDQEMSPQQEQAYNKMMKTLSKMNTKIQKVKNKMHGQQLTEKKNKTDEITNKLINAKENSEIITKQNLLTDITENYQHVVLGVYSENSKLKKKIEEMAKIIHEQNAKIYDHRERERELQRENQELRAEILRMKDQKMVMGRGLPLNNQQKAPQESPLGKKKGDRQNTGQNEDFDFWSMPQNDYGKKKKDFVQDSSLWVNQRQLQESAFITDNNNTYSNKKKR